MTLSRSFYLEFYLWKIFEVRIEAALLKKAFEFAFASYLRMLANWYDCITSLKLWGLQMDHEFKCMWKFPYSYILLGKFWNKKLFSLFLSVNQEWRLLWGVVSALRKNLLFDVPPWVSPMLHFPASPAAFKAEAQGLQGLVETLGRKVCFDACLPSKVSLVSLCFWHLQISSF